MGVRVSSAPARHGGTCPCFGCVAARHVMSAQPWPTRAPIALEALSLDTLVILATYADGGKYRDELRRRRGEK